MVRKDLFDAADMEVSIGSGAVRRDPIYNLSRDGFALLAMGFTGKQALTFKLAYISAFNEMEGRLRQPYVAPLAEDLEFARGLRIKDKLMLHEQAYKASRALSVATNGDERRQPSWQLYQVNTALGVPMPTMDALGVTPLAASNRLPHGPDRREGEAEKHRMKCRGLAGRRVRTQDADKPIDSIDVSFMNEWRAARRRPEEGTQSASQRRALDDSYGSAGGLGSAHGTQ